MDLLRLKGAAEFKPKIIELFENARHSADVVSSLYPSFYGDENVRKAIEQCAANTKKFRLLIDDGNRIEKVKSELPWLIKLKEKYPHTFDIRVINQPFVRHLMIIDQNLRIEELHEKNIDETKNLIIKDAPLALVDSAIDLFNMWWNFGKQLEVKIEGQAESSEF